METRSKQRHFLSILFILTLGFVLGGGLPAFAQNGSISGTVYQADGTTKITQGIDVFAVTTDLQTTYSDTVNQNGKYTIILPSGEDYYLYTVNTGSASPYYLDENWTGADGDPSSYYHSDANPISVDGSIDGKDFYLARGGKISGTVKDESGTNPVTGKNLQIFAFPGNWQWLKENTTEVDPSDGMYTIILPPGDYYLYSYNGRDSHNYVNEYWKGNQDDPSSYGSFNANFFSIAANADQTKNFHLELGGSISGKCYDSSGSLIAGPDTPKRSFSIYFYQGDPCEDGNHYIDKGYLYPDGTYKIWGVPKGTWFLRSYVEGYVYEWWTDGTPDSSSNDCSQAAQIVISSENESISNKDFKLDSLNTITGTITDLEQGQTINIYANQNNLPGFSTSITGDGTGTDSYALDVNPGSGYRISFDPDGKGVKAFYKTGETNGTFSWDQATLLDMNSDDQSGIDLTITSGNTIEGTITGLKTGQEIWIYANSDNGTPDDWSDDLNFNTWLTGDSDENSNDAYSIQVAKKPGYKVQFSPDNALNVHYSDSDPEGTSWNSATVLDLSSGDQSGIDLTITSGNTISGTITDLAKDQKVNVHAHTDNDTPDDPFDDSGYRTDVIGDGSGSDAYSIQVAKKPGYKVQFSPYNALNVHYSDSDPTGTSWNNATVLDLSSGDQSGIDLTITSGNTISGTITDLAKDQEIWIHANSDNSTPNDWSDDLHFNTWLKSDGSGSDDYSIQVAPKPGYKVQFSPYNALNVYYSDSETTGTDWNNATVLDLSSGDQAGINLTITSGKTISGTITGLKTGQEIWIHANSDNSTLDWSDDLHFNTWLKGDGDENTADPYSLQVAPDLEYKVQFSPDNALSVYYKDGNPEGASWNNATVLDLSLNQTDINMEISSGHFISGRVTEAATGNGVANIHVHAHSDSLNQGYGDNTDPDGYYSFCAAPAADYRVQVGGSDYPYAHQYYKNTSKWSLATLVDVSSSDRQNINFSLSEGKTISGKITDSNGDGIEQAWVDAWSDSTGCGMGSFTGQNGDYQISGLVAAGDFRVHVSSDNYTHEFYKTGGSGTSSWDKATLVDTQPGDITGIDIQLSSGGTIKGTITGLEAGTRVWINAWSDSAWAGNGAELKNENGTYYLNGQGQGNSSSYTIKGLDDSINDYIVDVWSEDGYQHAFYKQGGTTANWMEADELSVDSTNIDITLSKGKTISGTISGLAGSDEIWVNAHSQSTGSGSGVKSGNGAYEISGLASADDYRVNAWGKGYASIFYDGTANWDQANLVDASASQTGIDFVMTSGGSISGTITGLKDGEKAWINAWSNTQNAGNGVEIYNNNGTYILNGDWSASNTTGEYTISGLAKGDGYKVEVWSDNYQHIFYDDTDDGTTRWDQAQLIDISSANASGKDFTLSPGGSVTGTVKGLENGETAWINVWNPVKGVWGGTHITGTGGDMDFTATGLAPGDGYIVEPYSENHPRYFYKKGATGNLVLEGNVNWIEETSGGKTYWAPDDSTVTKVSVPQGATTLLSDMDLNAITSYNLTFKVTATDGNGLEQGTNLWTGVWSDANNAGAWQYVTIDEPSETVTISGIIPGDDYRLDIWSDKYCHVFYAASETNFVTPDWNLATILDLTQDKNLSSNIIKLSSGDYISGTVTVNGSPKNGLWVDAWSDKKGTGNGAQTDGSGKYKIEGLPPTDDYHVEVCDAAGCAQLDNIDISNGGVTGKDLSIGSGTIDISGTVTVDGTAKSGAVVALFSDSGNMFEQAVTTSATGVYEFVNLDNGNYIIKVDFEGDGVYDQDSEILSGSSDTVHFCKGTCT